MLLDATWAAPVWVSPDYGPGTQSSDPDVTVSPVTHTPVAVFATRWDPGDGNAQIINFARAERRADGSLDWSGTRERAVEVLPRGTKPGVASLAVGAFNGQETVHVTYWDHGYEGHPASEDFMYVRSLDGGRTWSAPFNLSNSGQVAGKVGLAADVVGNVYAVWSDWRGNPNVNGQDIWFRQYSSVTGQWTAAKKIESDPATKSSYPTIIRSPGGRLDAAWADRVVVPRRVSYTRSNDNGATWSPVETVFTAPDDRDVAGRQSITLTIAADGTAYVAAALPPAFGNTGTTYTWYSYKEPGQPWSTARRVFDSHPSANPFFTADRSGRVYLSWLQYNDGAAGPWDILVKYRDGDAAHDWSDPPPEHATTTGTWKGYYGGHITVDTRESVPTEAYVVTDDTVGGSHQIYATSADVSSAVTTVTGRRVFYNNSAFDGNGPAINAADDNAVAPDKAALLPGRAATAANYTSYSKGINGLMIDLAGAAAPPLSADDFEFRVGNSGAPSTWAIAPPPADVAVRALPTGANLSRVAITWPDGAIRNKWLQVTVRANDDTGLRSPDVFYFGNAVGETGNSSTVFRVDRRDVAATRNAQRKPTMIGNPFDHNRDGRINSRDVVLARNNQRFALSLLTAPPAAAAGAESRAGVDAGAGSTRERTRRASPSNR